MDYPMWGKEAVKELIEMAVPPDEEKHGFDDRILFFDLLTLSFALKEDGKLLYDELSKKWAAEVEQYKEEAERRAEEVIKKEATWITENFLG